MIAHLVFHHFCEYEESEKHTRDKIKNTPIEELLDAAKEAIPAVMLELINQPTISDVRRYFHENYGRIMQTIRRARILLLTGIRAIEIGREIERIKRKIGQEFEESGTKSKTGHVCYT